MFSRKFIFLSAVSFFSVSTVSFAETLKAISNDDAQVHVATVVSSQEKNLGELETSAVLTTAYRGGIAAPFAGFVTIFDPTPQDGGDFGSVKVFRLPNSPHVPEITSIKVMPEKGKKSSRFILFIKTATWNPDTDAVTEQKMQLIGSVNEEGEVSANAELKPVTVEEQLRK